MKANDVADKDIPRVPRCTADDLLRFADETDQLDDSDFSTWEEIQNRISQKYSLAI